MKYFIVLLTLVVTTALLAEDYYPPRGEWQTRDAGKMGFDTEALQVAIDYALANEYSGDRDLRRAILKGFSHEPFHEILGPTRKRGGPAGLILKEGYIVAQWGDVNRVDMTFSVTKSYLSTVAGLAVDEGLIETSDLLADSIWSGEFAGEHNRQISWAHLLNQSSDWSGELFGIKDWADRPPKEGGLDDWKFRELHKPGTQYEYNDVRVNLLAYALLHTWRKPLPMVLKERLMDPIGASTTWRWFGYEDAWVVVDGVKMKSVTGGGHSGGGVFISSLDQARFGLLFEREGQWDGKQIISKAWIKEATTSSPTNPRYGYMWWLNKGDRKWPGVADESIFYGSGFGGNYVIVDQSNDLVVITRWLEPRQLGEFMQRLYQSLDE